VAPSSPLLRDARCLPLILPAPSAARRRFPEVPHTGRYPLAVEVRKVPGYVDLKDNVA
jgi:hypothetical protein